MKLWSPVPGIAKVLSFFWLFRCWPQRNSLERRLVQSMYVRLRLEAKYGMQRRKTGQLIWKNIFIQSLTLIMFKNKLNNFSHMLGLFPSFLISVKSTWLGLVNLLESLLAEGKHTRRTNAKTNFITTYDQLHFKITCKIGAFLLSQRNVEEDFWSTRKQSGKRTLRRLLLYYVIDWLNCPT